MIIIVIIIIIIIFVIIVKVSNAQCDLHYNWGNLININTR